MRFVKAVAVALLLTTLLVGSFTGTRVLQDYTSFDKPRSYTVMLVSKHGLGSGVVLAPGLVLTAAHVTGPEGKGFTVNGLPVESVIRFDDELDLALLEVPGIECPCTPFGTLPLEDDRLVAVGYPLGVGQFATEGRMQTTQIKDYRLETSVPIMFGNSGGPLFAFQQGQWKLVGIMVQVHGANLGFFGVPVPTMSRAVPIVNIMEFLHRKIVK